MCPAPVPNCEGHPLCTGLWLILEATNTQSWHNDCVFYLKRKLMRLRFALSLTLVCMSIFAPSVSASSSKAYTLEAVYANDSPATVQIVYTPPDFPAQAPIIYGTGFFIGDQGYFITADHVVDKYEKGTPRETAVIHQRDGNGTGLWFELVEEDKEHDLALCKVIGGFPLKKALRILKEQAGRPPASLRPVTSLVVADRVVKAGEPIALLGFPLGAFVTPVIQGGNVAATNAVLMAAYNFPGFHGQDNFIVSVAGNHGNSGGPVISLSTNEVVGVLVQYVPAPLIRTADGNQIPQQSGLMVAVPTKYVIQLLKQNHVSLKAITLKDDLVF